MKICALIINYNDSNRINSLIDILNTYKIIDDFVVVDNNSKIEEKIKLDKEKNNVTYIFNQENVGYNKAMNIGLKYLTSINCDYVIAINSDINISKQAILECINVLNKEDDIAVVSCKMIENNKEKEFYYNFPTVHSEIRNNLGITKIFNLKPKIKNKKDNICYVDFIRFSYGCIRLSAVKEINYLDDSTFLYFGEAMLAKKLLKIGYKEAFINNQIYFHNHIYANNYKKNGYIYTYKDSLIYLKKYAKFNKFYSFLLKISYKIGYFIRILTKTFK